VVPVKFAEQFGGELGSPDGAGNGSKRHEILWIFDVGAGSPIFTLLS
jgi:hypothetical protein